MWVGGRRGIRKLSTCTQDPVAMWENWLHNPFVAFAGFHANLIKNDRRGSGGTLRHKFNI